MKKAKLTAVVAFIFLANISFAQKIDSAIINNIINEETNHSQLEPLAHELLDGIGPRLIGSPKMLQANNWAVDKYKSWGIDAKNEKWGEWRGWERGITHIDMVAPWIKTLEGTQLAWSPSTKGKTITGEVIILPDPADSVAFQKWLPSVKGKFVMISMNQPTGRPDDNWEEFGTKESVQKMKDDREQQTSDWRKRISNTGFTTRTLPIALENAGAIGIVENLWSKGFGVD
ncbi:MAG TPA: hypothetical protein VN726_03805, partial [Hanamia sp.]|nr:hypothetical protein [Hanamia sp.]